MILKVIAAIENITVAEALGVSVPSENHALHLNIIIVIIHMFTRIF